MSVIVMSNELLSKVRNKARSFEAFGPVDMNYCYILSHMKRADIDKWLIRLFRLNERSSDQLHHRKTARMRLEFKENTEDIDIYQFLKYLDFIDYNIDVCRKGKAVELLRKVREEISGRIISSMQEYRKANWCE